MRGESKLLVSETALLALHLHMTGLSPGHGDFSRRSSELACDGGRSIHESRSLSIDLKSSFLEVVSSSLACMTR